MPKRDTSQRRRKAPYPTSLKTAKRRRPCKSHLSAQAHRLEPLSRMLFLQATTVASEGGVFSRRVTLRGLFPHADKRWRYPCIGVAAFQRYKSNPKLIKPQPQTLQHAKSAKLKASSAHMANSSATGKEGSGSLSNGALLRRVLGSRNLVYSSYGPLSDLNQRLSKLEVKLTAKLDDAGYLETQFAEQVHIKTTADALIGPYANDRTARVSAAFEFASAFWPADPGDATAYRVGFTSDFVGRSYLSKQLTQASIFPSAQAAYSHGHAVSVSIPSRRRHHRRPSLASSVSTVPSDATGPLTPHSPGHVRVSCNFEVGCEAICAAALGSPAPLPAWVMPSSTQQNTALAAPALQSNATGQGGLQDGQRDVRLPNILNPVQCSRPDLERVPCEPLPNWHHLVSQFRSDPPTCDFFPF